MEMLCRHTIFKFNRNNRSAINKTCSGCSNLVKPNLIDF